MWVNHNQYVLLTHTSSNPPRFPTILPQAVQHPLADSLSLSWQEGGSGGNEVEVL